ncbi:LuxR C-terminal-related transcriptional regulator [Kitasatospora sp. NBC_01287]|uniref:helix-turn-helix transcriptional regulator n=1 Tax=Kitasatospora sp. NBC_01287 TaxID=2903573 RepID=UPI0022565040|nr:LuxR family transcriptional regulator [Kitasatospora sp. NBC_01287]MCX4745779.1 LuxR C-terminal-related transcriptional regulator [Kitasatospora sp. NBC_01287]
MAFRLDLLGLDADSARVYEYLLREPAADGAELARQLGWAPDRVHAALGELASVELVRPSWQQPGAVRAIEPEVGLAALLARQEAELRRRQEAVEAGRMMVRRLVEEHAEYRRSQQEAPVEVLTGIDAIRLRIQSLVADCTSELVALVPGGGQQAANMAASRHTDQSLMERGVAMRSVYLESVSNHAPTVEYTRWLTSLGAQVRTAATLPARMAIYDRRVALVPLDPESAGQGAMVIRSPGAVRILRTLFEYVWAGAVPFGEASEPGEHGLTAQERALLTLLARGHADEVVARRLGVSVRTARRITANLMARLDAGSRFQAGAKAVLRGWLDPDDLV